MTRIQPWTHDQLMTHEEVFEALVRKAVASTVKAAIATLDAPLTAASLPHDPHVYFTAAEKAVQASWVGFVERDLFPFLTETFLQSAERVTDGIAQASGVVVDTLTNTYAEDFLQYAQNRMVDTGDQLWEKIRAELSAGFAAGDSIPQIAERVTKATGLATPRALTVARTEVISAANAGSYLQMLDSGFDEPVTKVWLATEHSDRTRLAHRHANDQGVPLADEFSVDIYKGDVKTGSEGMEFPGDPVATPGNIINCRCSLAFDFSEDEDVLAAAVNWVEKKHPRDGDGKFKKKGAADKYVKLPALADKPANTAPTAEKAAWIIAHKWPHLNAGQKNIFINSLDEDTWTKMPPVLKAKVLDPSWLGSHPEAKTLLEKSLSKLEAFGDVDAEPDDEGDGDTPASAPSAGGRPLGGTITKTGKAWTPGAPTALKVQLLFNTTFEDGAIVAVRKDSNERVVWNGTTQKMDRQLKGPDGKYKTTESLTRGALYKKYKDEEGWTIPTQEDVQQTAAPSAGPSNAPGKPLALKVQVLYNAKYAPGEVIAERVSSSERLVWNGKKIERQVWSPAAGKWETSETVTRGAAYKMWKDEQGWTSPTGAVGGLAAPAIPEPVTSEGTKPDPVNLPTNAGLYADLLGDPAFLKGKVLTSHPEGITVKKESADAIAVVNPANPFGTIILSGPQITQAKIDDAVATHLAENAADKAQVKQFFMKEQAQTYKVKSSLLADDLASISTALDNPYLPKGTVLYSSLDSKTYIVKDGPGYGTLAHMGEVDDSLTSSDFQSIGKLVQKMVVLEDVAKAKKQAVPASSSPELSDGDFETITDGFPGALVNDMLYSNEALEVEKLDSENVVLTHKASGNTAVYEIDAVTVEHINDFLDLHAGNNAADPVPQPVAGPILYTKAQQIKKLADDPSISPLTTLWQNEDVQVIKGGNGVVGLSSKKSSGGFATLDSSEITADNLNAHIAQVMLGNKSSAPNAMTGIATDPDSGDTLVDVSTLKSTGKTVGTHGGKIYKDANGEEWLFKPAPSSSFKSGVYVDKATAELHELAGLPTPQTEITTLDGDFGSLQKIIPNAKEPFNFAINPKGLDDGQALEIQREHIFDWLVSNHDAHGKNLLQGQDGLLVGIDKGQSFKYFGADKLDWNLKPNEHPQAALELYKAYAAGEDVKLFNPATSVALGKFIDKLQAIPDDQYKEILRPYAEQAAKEGKLAVGGPSGLGLGTVPFLSNDVDAFLDAAVKRKASLKADIQAFYDKAASARAKKTGKPYTPVPVSAGAPKSVPISMTYGLLVNPKTTQYKDGQVIAEHPVEDERLIWDGAKKKYAVQAKTSAGWVTIHHYSKQGAYKHLKDDSGWHSPSTSQVQANAGASAGDANVPTVHGGSSAPAVVVPKPVKPLTDTDFLAQGGHTVHLDPDDLNSIYEKFRNPSGKSKVTLSASAEDMFSSLLEVRAAFNQEAHGKKVTLLQAIRAVDRRAAEKASVANDGKFEEKIVAWLKTPAGQLAAADLIAESRVPADEKKKLLLAKMTQKQAQAAANAPAAWLSVMAVPVTTPAVKPSDAKFVVRTPQQAYDLDKQMHGGVAGKSKWTQAQQDAVYAYTVSSENMNWYMRSYGDSTNIPASAYASFDSLAAGQAKALQEAMKPTPKDILIFRNVANVFSSEASQPSAAEAKARIGTVFTEVGFSSTSVDKNVFNSGRRYRYDIEVPEGTPAVWAQQHTAHSGEKEFILGAGMNFELVDVYEETVSGTAKIVLKVRVVP